MNTCCTQTLRTTVGDDRRPGRSGFLLGDEREEWAACAGMAILLAALVLFPLPGHAQEPADEAEALLAKLSEAVHTQVTPRLAELSFHEVQREVGELAREILGPHMQSFRKKAKSRIDALPVRTIPEKEYVDMYPGKQKQIAGGVGMLRSLSSATADSLFLMSFWDPVEAATRTRALLLSRVLSVKEIGKRTLVDRVAPPTVYCADRDYERPTICLESGAELSVIRLEYADGLYKATSARWLRKRSVGGQQPRQGVK